ncbi:MAG: hypothetical protein ABW168_20820 [Sedimenticola sp.]
MGEDTGEVVEDHRLHFLQGGNVLSPLTGGEVPKDGEETRDEIALLIPPPRRHRHCYHGVLAPNAPLQEQLTNRTGQPVTGESVVSANKSKAGEREEQAVGCLFASIWAMLLARVYEINPLVYPRCGGEMRIIALTYRDVLMLREACLQGCR